MTVEQKIPSYIHERKNTIHLILFTAFFALIFINVFKPFGSRSWYPNISDLTYFIFSSLIVLTGMLVVVLSRLLMGLYTKRNGITYIKYIIWVAAEILAMSLFYALFTKYIPKEGVNKDFIITLQEAIKNSSLVLLLPYAMAWLYFSWKDKNHLLEKITQAATPVESPKKGLIRFPDEKGELKISIMVESLLYIDSADNYATIYYLNKSKITNFLIRNSLKWMDENLSKDTPLVRCHRSYIVNLDKVKVLRKTKEGIFLELDALNTPDIPVSKTYYDRVMEKFSQYSV